jgi:hypothetical protein
MLEILCVEHLIHVQVMALLTELAGDLFRVSARCSQLVDAFLAYIRLALLYKVQLIAVGVQST